MPTWLNAIVTCSCGAKWGDAARARRGGEFTEDIERTILAGFVTEMIRHWRLSHLLTGRGAQWEPVITQAAAKIAIQEEGARP